MRSQTFARCGLGRAKYNHDCFWACRNSVTLLQREQQMGRIAAASIFRFLVFFAVSAAYFMFFAD
jgi:hypothetical protein